MYWHLLFAVILFPWAPLRIDYIYEEIYDQAKYPTETCADPETREELSS